MTSDGRIDLLIRTTDFIYVIECKLDSSAKVALKQIERKEYDLPWSVDNRKIILIGINFSSNTRRMTDWLVGGQNESLKVVKEGGQRGGQTTEQILGLIKKNPYITRDELTTILGISPSAIQKHINKLKKDRIRRIDGKQKGHWEIIEN